MGLVALQFFILGFQCCSLVAQIATGNTLWVIGSVGLGFAVVGIGVIRSRSESKIPS